MPTTGRNQISLYFHIPFCKSKCPYCHFYSIYFNKNEKERFIKALKKEIENKLDLLKDKTILSIYFGGGTPSLLDPEDISEILKYFKIFKETEITLEVNPDSIDLDKIKGLKKAKINRISIGAQSFDDSLLKTLKREHTSQQTLHLINQIYLAGIDNISIDLMYDIPNQTFQSFQKDIEIVRSLPITHISLYNLTIEENTPFYKEKETLEKEMPNANESLNFFQYARSSLKKMGFEQYEISAFCKNNKRSIHNCGYWEGRQYLGFGPSSFSYFDKKRYKNISNLRTYIHNITNNLSTVDFSEELAYPENIKELLIIRLRMFEKLDLDKFQNEFGKIDENTLTYMKSSDLLTFENNICSLSEKGILFYDSLAVEII